MKSSTIDRVKTERSPKELRREPRRPAKGSVIVGATQGQLVDVSESGFRMAHASAGFEPGQELGFQHADAKGTARVIWNRIIKGRVETGFFITART